MQLGLSAFLSQLWVLFQQNVFQNFLPHQQNFSLFLLCTFFLWGSENSDEIFIVLRSLSKLALFSIWFPSCSHSHFSNIYVWFYQECLERVIFGGFFQPSFNMLEGSWTIFCDGSQTKIWWLSPTIF